MPWDAWRWLSVSARSPAPSSGPSCGVFVADTQGSATDQTGEPLAYFGTCCGCGRKLRSTVGPVTETAICARIACWIIREDPTLRRTLEWRGEDAAEAAPQINLDEGDPEPELVVAGDKREQLTLVEVAAIAAEAPPDP
jgi:hypothetical protein